MQLVDWSCSALIAGGALRGERGGGPWLATQRPLFE